MGHFAHIYLITAIVNAPRILASILQITMRFGYSKQNHDNYNHSIDSITLKLHSHSMKTHL